MLGAVWESEVFQLNQTSIGISLCAIQYAGSEITFGGNYSSIETEIISVKVRGEGRTEDKSSSLTGLNLIYPGLLVFYVEVCKIQKLSRPEIRTWHGCSFQSTTMNVLGTRVARKTSTTSADFSTT